MWGKGDIERERDREREGESKRSKMYGDVTLREDGGRLVGGHGKWARLSAGKKKHGRKPLRPEP